MADAVAVALLQELQDGLPDSRVAPSIQDREGNLWFGMQDRLARYDGRGITTQRCTGE